MAIAEGMHRMTLTADERGELEAVIRKRSGSAALARRARCLLLCADGERRVDIRAKLECNAAFVTRWTRAFELQGLAGLVSLHPGWAPVRPVAKLEARVLNKALKHKPKDGSTHWSSRKPGNAEAGATTRLLSATLSHAKLTHRRDPRERAAARPREPRPGGIYLCHMPTEITR
jgi:hypothetical protein